jgi:hypothetical protein
MDSKKIPEKDVSSEEYCEGEEVDQDEGHDEKITPPLFKIDDLVEREMRKGKWRPGGRGGSWQPRQQHELTPKQEAIDYPK